MDSWAGMDSLGGGRTEEGPQVSLGPHGLPEHVTHPPGSKSWVQEGQLGRLGSDPVGPLEASGAPLASPRGPTRLAASRGGRA